MSATIFDLVNAVSAILKRVAQREGESREIFEDKWSVSEKIEMLVKRITEKSRVSRGGIDSARLSSPCCCGSNSLRDSRRSRARKCPQRPVAAGDLETAVMRQLEPIIGEQLSGRPAIQRGGVAEHEPEHGQPGSQRDCGLENLDREIRAVLQLVHHADLEEEPGDTKRVHAPTAEKRLIAARHANVNST